MLNPTSRTTEIAVDNEKLALFATDIYKVLRKQELEAQQLQGTTLQALCIGSYGVFSIIIDG